ncbi:MAG: DUF3021 family protein [Eubacteriales bacterium]
MLAGFLCKQEHGCYRNLSVIAVVVSFLIWFGFYLYYRQEAKRINAKLKEKQGI